MRTHLGKRSISMFVLSATTMSVLFAPSVYAQSGPAGTVRYYHADAVGSIRAVTDAQGTVVARHDYFPFGDEPASAPNPAAQRFTGEERDRESGMDYFGARYYMQRPGRFTTVDPGHVGGNIFDPQSWNAYAYARNNPLRFVYPTGTDYRVNVFGGDSFWVQTDRDLQGLEQGGFSFRGGNIFNSAGTWVGTYDYFDPFARLAFDVSRTAGPGVNAAVGLGVATTAIPAVAIGGGALVAGGGGTVVLGGMGGSMAAAISQISNPRVRDALSALYQHTDRFRGGTAAAVQFTRETGRLVGGSNHLIKAADRMRQLENILRTENLSPSDRRLAEYALNRLKELNLK
jgi:RHS repeat-associated protein